VRLCPRILESLDLIFSPCLVEIPEITISILWHAQHHRDPGNRWLRQLIFDQSSAGDNTDRPCQVSNLVTSISSWDDNLQVACGDLTDCSCQLRDWSGNPKNENTTAAIRDKTSMIESPKLIADNSQNRFACRQDEQGSRCAQYHDGNTGYHCGK
jgi:hypothetical protein